MNNIQPEDFAWLLTVLTTLVVPLVIGWLREKTDINSITKFGIAVGLSIVISFLRAYVDGEVATTRSIIYNAGIVFTGTHAAFLAFRELGFEKSIYPRTGLIEDAKKQVEQQLSETKTEEARAVLDENEPSKLTVVAHVIHSDSVNIPLDNGQKL